MNIALQHRIEDRSIPEPNGGCWLWLGCCTHNGYPHLTFQGKQFRGHRLAWQAYHGAIPFGLNVLHRCDVRSCVNPDHLFLGTDADNMSDMISKGRAKHSNGEQSSRAVLTETEALEIINSPLSIPQLARKYDVGHATIWSIRARKSWRHLSAG